MFLISSHLLLQLDDCALHITKKNTQCFINTTTLYTPCIVHSPVCTFTNCHFTVKFNIHSWFQTCSIGKRYSYRYIQYIQEFLQNTHQELNVYTLHGCKNSIYMLYIMWLEIKISKNLTKLLPNFDDETRWVY